MPFDLVALGEPLLRLSPPGRGQLRRAAVLEARVVGSQMNVAANLARLGRSTALATRLPDGPLGLLALDALRGYGVDTSLVRLVPGGKLGVTYVEFAAAPRAPLAVYDRAGSAASTIAAADFDWNAIAAARAVYSDGIFPGLSAGCREAARALLRAGRQAGALTVFDVNYREHLWTPAAARQAFSELLPLVDAIVTNRNVSQEVFGMSGTDEELARAYADQFGSRVVCLTSRTQEGWFRGSWSSAAWCGGLWLAGRPQVFEIVDRYGTGDAFAAGLIDALLDDPQDVARALDFGNALCALAHTVEGDVAHLTREEANALLRGGPDGRLRR